MWLARFRRDQLLSLMPQAQAGLTLIYVGTRRLVDVARRSPQALARLADQVEPS